MCAALEGSYTWDRYTVDFYTNLWGWLTWSPCKIMQAYTIGMCAYIYIYMYGRVLIARPHGGVF